MTYARCLRTTPPAAPDIDPDRTIGSGHWPMITYPEQMAKVILESVRTAAASGAV
ncbi:hypothetical protein Vau01_105230 [Virgisporangium aurantiacum]|uniref:Uncharacterized protein n=1 Tax=Virgisporangium aurantiacum TaxID=175570 RepID=A0A8J3ZHI1_9ACTN|nr:hypothetical protein Vau01_105230 [Virgisporangium aurantiacum]